MPEGPEIRREADRISKKIVGKEVHSVNLIYPPIAEFQDILQQSQIESIATRGKAMLIRFDCGLSMYSHNQLYGRWTINRLSTEMKWNRTLRVEFLTNKFAVRLWSATDVEIIPTSKEEHHPFIAKLGPDILDDSCTPSLIFNRLRSKKFCNRKASSLMLDQSFIAGIGNYLRSEILHQSGIHPNAKPRSLSDSKIQSWAEVTKSLSELSYVTGGFTVSEKVALDGKQRGEPKRAYRHSAFCRNELQCHYCDRKIVRIKVANRRLDFCPKCQDLNN